MRPTLLAASAALDPAALAHAAFGRLAPARAAFGRLAAAGATFDRATLARAAFARLALARAAFARATLTRAAFARATVARGASASSLVALLSIGVLAPVAAVGAPWPERPIRIVVASGAGSVMDSAARVVARAMQKNVGQPVIVENRPGGDGAAAATSVKNAPPDGYTLLYATNSTLALPLTQKNAGFDPLTDFAAISTVGGVPYAMLVNPKVPVRSVQELVAHASSSKLTYGTVTAGEYLAASQFAKGAGIEMTRVPYSASPVADVAAGKIQLYVAPVPQALAESRGGRVRLLATLTAERTPATPAVPALGEEALPVPSANLSHHMLLAPAKTPIDVVARLAREVQAAVGAKAVKAELQQLSLIPRASGAGELAKRLAEDQQVWTRFVREAGLAPK